MTARRKRIGFLVNDMAWLGNYTHTLWTSAARHCQLRGIDLLLLADPQRVDNYVAQQVKTAIFRMIDTQRMDGLVFSSSVKYFRDAQWLPEFLSEFSHIPMVCIAEALPGIHSVLIDNVTGMRELVEHLITVHGCRQQAFVRGPLAAMDSNVRYDTWVKTLTAHGIAVDPELVLSGNFDTVDQPERLALAWQAGRKFSAVVVACDTMALHMISVLRRFGIRVPQDVAVVGFDDNPENRFSDPPLSSVYQSVRDQVAVGIDVLVDVWAGRERPLEVVMPTAVHIRGSCGCALPHWTVEPELERALLDSASGTNRFGDPVLASVHSADNPPDRAFDILAAIEALQNNGRLTAKGVSAAEVDACCSRLYLQTLADMRLGQVAGPTQGSRVLESILEIAGAGRLATAVDILTTNMAHLGLSKFCFSVFSVLAGEAIGAGNATMEPAASWLVPVAMFPETLGARQASGFRATLLAPDEWFDGLEQSALLVLPIVSRAAWLGLLVCDIAPGKEAMVLQLQGALSMVCERENLIAQAMRQNAAEWSRGLVKAEKSRTTASLVRGVAHEINTPLGNCVSVVSTLNAKLGELQSAFAAGKISRQNLSLFITSTHQGLDVLGRSLDRMATLIQTFKKVSPAEYSDLAERFDMAHEVQVVLNQCQADLQARLVSATLVCTGPVEVRTQRSFLHEVLWALIQNAVGHAFPHSIPGAARIAVSIDLLEEGRVVRLRVADNGIGIPAELQDQIFEPFFSTKRSMGQVGLGLAIVRGLVTDRLGGSLACIPNPGGGTVFEVLFPTAPAALPEGTDHGGSAMPSDPC